MKDELKGQRLGKYEILDEVGRGGFATVYRARDKSLGREVAVKVLDPLMMRDEAFVARFQREARAAAALEHPHIVPIYEVGEADGRLFIAMRLARGPSLARYLEQRGSLPWAETLAILRQVSDALAYAHSQGIVHRDIKPQNILLDERAGPLLTDFGFAQLLGSSSLSQSLSGGIVGTPAYIPPEIWEGAKATPATDVYALACVVYEMLTGQTLFGGETPMAIMRAHDKGANLPTEWPIGVPQGIGEVMARALARDPQNRYPSVGAFMEALEGLNTAAEAARVAMEVQRLSEEMRAALAAGHYEKAVAAGGKLLKLQPDNREGAALLGQAQAKLEKRKDLAMQLEQGRQALQHDRHALEARQKALDEKRVALKDATASLEAERAQLQQRLEELRKSLAKYEDDAKAVANEEQTLADEADELDRRAERLDAVAELLAAGKLDEAERRLAEPREAKAATPRHASAAATDQPTGEWVCPTCGHSNEAWHTVCPACGRKRAERPAEWVQCPKCGERNHPARQYCLHCGVRLASAPSAPGRDKETLTQGWVRCGRCGVLNEAARRECIVCHASLDEKPAEQAQKQGKSEGSAALALTGFVAAALGIALLSSGQEGGYAALVFGVLALLFALGKWVSSQS